MALPETSSPFFRRSMSALWRVMASVFVAVFVLTSMAQPADARAKRTSHKKASHHKSKPYTPGSAFLIMDSDTGLILDQSNANTPLHPASLVKTMTLLLTFEALQRGDLRLSDSVPISNHAASMPRSNLDMPAGSSIRVQDAILAVVTKSANDIAVALGEKLAGTEGRFSLVMNRRAQQLGMRHTVFMNASGLHDPAQVSTARDMALLARYIITTYPQYYRYFATRDFNYRGNTYHTHNRLMDTYSGMDGMKTGFIQQSGFNLIASAKRNGHRLIGVVFGGRSTNSRNYQMASLLNRGFASANTGTLVAAAAPQPVKKPVLTPAPVKLAMADAAAPATEDDIDPALESGTMGSMIGQGDIDPAVSSRFETGLQAIAAIRQQSDKQASLPGQESWSIQIGAGSSRSRIDSLLQAAQARLPARYNKGAPVIVPLKTSQGWVFRGRLSGYSKAEALSACQLLKDCVPVSPQAY
jgi:D-alanyl-D-alanine carboxypeptidase